MAAVVLQLIDEHRLELDAPLGRYVPASPFGDVTIRRLLSHTGGVLDFGQGAGYATDLLARPSRRWTTTGVLGLVADRDRDFPPGSAYAYSNTDAVLLGQAIEAVTGRSWAHAVQSRVIDRLDLRDTTVPGADAAAAPGVVAGWFDTSDDRVPDPWPALETSQGSAGALVSTAPELTVSPVPCSRATGLARRASGDDDASAVPPQLQQLRAGRRAAPARPPDDRLGRRRIPAGLPRHHVVPALDTPRHVVLANAYRASTDDLAELLLHR